MQRMVTALRRLVVAPVAVAAVAAPWCSGTAAFAAPASGVRAAFGSTVLDLSRSWGTAKSCTVFSRTDVRCYSSYAQADAALGYSALADPLVTAASAPACSSGWLCLYADAAGGGRRLQFQDEYWQSLGAYGFAGQTSSWRNNQGSSDTGYLELYNSANGYYCAPDTYVSSMGSADNQAYEVYG